MQTHAMHLIWGTLMLSLSGRSLFLALFSTLAAASFLLGSCSKANPAAESSYITVTVWDSGSLKDDVFDVQVDGVSLGKTPTGGSRAFSGNLEKGKHTLKLTWTVRANDVGTYSISLTGAVFSNGSTSLTDYMGTEASWQYYIQVP